MWSNSEMTFLLSFFLCTSSSETIEDHPYNRHNFPGEEIAVGGGGRGRAKLYSSLHI